MSHGTGIEWGSLFHTEDEMSQSIWTTCKHFLPYTMEQLLLSQVYPWRLTWGSSSPAYFCCKTSLHVTWGLDINWREKWLIKTQPFRSQGETHCMDSRCPFPLIGVHVCVKGRGIVATHPFLPEILMSRMRVVVIN